jgi:hypothetical protein
MLEIISAVFAAYVCTYLITSASILESFRVGFTNKVKIQLHPAAKPFIYCRMCTGFWISLFWAFMYDANFFIVYGLSYFLATQER